jgi:hypothetical protein
VGAREKERERERESVHVRERERERGEEREGERAAPCFPPPSLCLYNQQYRYQAAYISDKMYHVRKHDQLL